MFSNECFPIFPNGLPGQAAVIVSFGRKSGKATDRAVFAVFRGRVFIFNRRLFSIVG